VALTTVQHYRADCESKQIIGCASDVFFLKFSCFLTFLNIQIDLILLETDVAQFTLTTKKIIAPYVYR